MKVFSIILAVTAATASVTTSVQTDRYATLLTSQSGSILTVTINNNASIVNLIDDQVLVDLDRLVTSLQNNNATKVVLFQSLNPNFFAAHYDITPLIQGPGKPPLDPNNFLASDLMFKIAQLPQASIAVIDGSVRGIGNEFIMACDMRFASAKAVMGQFEVTLGLNLGAGGVSFMPLIMGRGRAMEYLLSGKDINAFEAERFGLVNKAFGSSDDLYKYVNQLAMRIGLFPAGALASIKSSVNSIASPTRDQLRFDHSEFLRLTATADGQALLKKFITLTKNQTDVAVELHLGDEVLHLYT